MNSHKIYLWGFETADLAGWPYLFETIHIAETPAPGPLLVHARAIEEYITLSQTQTSEDGRLPEALLYLPRGSAKPKGVWAYFDQIIQEGDWATLDRHLSCPQRLRVVEMADEVPGRFLSTLNSPIENLPAAQLPLPSDVQNHLAGCAACRQAFDQEVKERIQWRRQVRYPSRAEIGPIQPEMSEDTSLSALLLTIRLAWGEAQTHLAEWGRVPSQTLRPEWAQALLTLLSGLQSAGLHPSYAGGLVTGAGQGGAKIRRVNATSPTPTRLLNKLDEAKELHLAQLGRSLHLHWEEREQTLWLGALRQEGGQEVRSFRVELWQGESCVWSAESQRGGAEIPLSQLAGALADGADRIQIRDTSALA